MSSVPARRSVEIRLFAAARELVGADAVTLEIEGPLTPQRIRHELAAEYPALATIAAHSMIAVGHSYVADTQELDPQLPVSLIPPVSGG